MPRRKVRALVSHLAGLGMLGTDIVHPPETVEHGHLLRHGSAVVQEPARTREDLQGLRSRHPFHDPNEPAKSHMQVELPAVAPGRDRQRAGQLDGVRQVLDRLDHGRASERALAGLVPIIDGEIVKAGLRVMMGQCLRLGNRNFGEPLLQLCPDAGVEGLALAAQQRAVGSVPHQGMFEQIARIWRRALPEQQACLHHAI